MIRFAFIFILVTPTVYATEYLELVESKVFDAPGSVGDITKRGELCIGQNVRNDPVQISDNAGNVLGMGLGSRSTGQIEGGPVIVKSDPDSGMVIANARISWNQLIVKNVTQSTLTFLAKDGRFKIQFTNIETLQKSTGTLENDGFSKQGKWFGSSWEKVQKTLLETAEKVAVCVMQPQTSADW